MSIRKPTRKPSDGDHTSLDIQSHGHRLSLAGPALAVVAVVALLGMIVVCWKLIDMSERAIVSKTPTAQLSR